MTLKWIAKKIFTQYLATNNCVFFFRVRMYKTAKHIFFSRLQANFEYFAWVLLSIFTKSLSRFLWLENIFFFLLSSFNFNGNAVQPYSKGMTCKDFSNIFQGLCRCQWIFSTLKLRNISQSVIYNIMEHAFLCVSLCVCVRLFSMYENCITKQHAKIILAWMFYIRCVWRIEFLYYTTELKLLLLHNYGKNWYLYEVFFNSANSNTWVHQLLHLLMCSSTFSDTTFT